MRNLLLVAFAMFVCWKLFGPESVVELGPGVKVTEIPLQTKPLNSDSFAYKNYQITPLADFTIKAKILSKTNYSLGRESDISPVDLALGWQNMSDESVLKNIDISQSGRWYYWHVKEFPIPRKEIETQSANMHIVPANKQVEGAISQTKQGEIIELSGNLVRVDAEDDSWHWQSSLTRDDTGEHACELVYVRQFKVLDLK